MSAEKLDFQAEVSKLLHIVTHSLYSDREVFLRELISNASDACDKLRYEALTRPELTEGNGEFAITVTIDKDRRTLTVSDNGIGMNRDDLIENLGTIAHSGTGAFLEQMEKAEDGGVSLIGQFGVGFYASFMVAEKVEVLSRKAGEDNAWHWESEGTGSYEIAEGERPGPGTDVILHIREDADEFLEAERIRQIVKTYSDHIAIPIRLKATPEEEGETVNQASALWTRPKQDISEEQYKEFYHHIAHAFDEPWGWLHTHVEGKVDYTLLLYIPGQKPFDLFRPERKHGVKLYVKRVFITEDCEDLVPPYLRFLRGVVDTEDLPLNVSRELLQNNPLIGHIRNAITKRVIKELERRAAKDKEAYETFWNNFGAVLKEGLYEDPGNREKLLKLARFRSAKSDGLISLEDYRNAMVEGQKAIYYITGEDSEALRQSPQLEGYLARGIDVLLLTDPIDDFWPQMSDEYEGLPLRSVTRGQADLDDIAAKDDKGDEKKESAAKGDIAVLTAIFKQALGDEVSDVRSSARLTNSAVCLVAGDTGLDMHLERLLKQQNQLEALNKRILEINPDHPLIRNLAAKAKDKAARKLIEDAAHLLLDQARVIEGEPLPDPAAFARRQSEFLLRALPEDANEQTPAAADDTAEKSAESADKTAKAEEDR